MNKKQTPIHSLQSGWLFVFYSPALRLVQSQLTLFFLSATSKAWQAFATLPIARHLIHNPKLARKFQHRRKKTKRCLLFYLAWEKRTLFAIHQQLLIKHFQHPSIFIHPTRGFFKTMRLNWVSY